MTRQEFKKRCKDQFEDWTQFERKLDKLLNSGAVNYEDADDSYRDIYPVVAAIYQSIVDDCIYGSSDFKKNVRAKRQMNNYLKFI